MGSEVKKIIGLDLDGVIADHTMQKISLAKQLGFELKPEDTPSDIIKSAMPLEFVRKLQFMLYENPDTALCSPLMSGAGEALREMQKQNTSYFLISRRRRPELAIKLLEMHGLWPLYFSERNSFLVREPEDKNIKAKELGITHYVDDEIKILEKLADVRYKFLFDSLRIARAEDSAFTKVSSWSDLLGYLL